MGLDKVLAKFSKKKLFGLVAGLHLLLICVLGMSFNFQKPEKEIKFKQIMQVSLAKLEKPPAPVVPVKAPEPIKPDPPKKKEPEKVVKKPDKPKVDQKKLAADKKKADFALKKKLENERKRQKKLEEERKRKKKLAAKKEKERKEKLRKKKLADERKRKEKIRQQKLAEQRRQKSLADQRAKAAAERVSNSLEATYLQELGQRLNLSWRKPGLGSGVQVGHYVIVRLTIERDGRISSAKIVGKRATATLEATVKDLLRRMKTFKRFPAKITERRITQDFKLEIE